MSYVDVISILLGYFLGSLNPSYLLGKLVRGIDLREHGSGNLGTMNCAHVLGWRWAWIPAVYDPLKGIIAIWLSGKIGATPLISYISGLCAIAGHRFPFYLGFRGGKGVAAAVGILLRNIFLMIKENQLPYVEISMLVPFVLCLISITHSGAITWAFFLPLLLYDIIFWKPSSLLLIFAAIVIAYILIMSIYEIIDRNLLSFADLSAHLKPWRFYLRPFALLFILFYELFGKVFAVTLIGAVTICFLIMEAVRLLHSGVNIFLFKNFVLGFKETEKHRFSSMTLFLISGTILFLLFEKEIAYTIFVYLIFGDMFAKYFGLKFGKRKLFHKTVEGFLFYVSSCIAIGTVLLHYLPVKVIEILLISFVMGLIEVLPLGIDDNLSTSIIGGIVYYLLKKGGV